jgi:hypothetical protein
MRTIRTSGLGKVTGEVKACVPEETNEALAALATVAGMTKSEYVRELLMGHVHGRLTVMRLRQGEPGRRGGTKAE